MRKPLGQKKRNPCRDNLKYFALCLASAAAIPGPHDNALLFSAWGPMQYARVRVEYSIVWGRVMANSISQSEKTEWGAPPGGTASQAAPRGLPISQSSLLLRWPSAIFSFSNCEVLVGMATSQYRRRATWGCDHRNNSSCAAESLCQ